MLQLKKIFPLLFLAAIVCAGITFSYAQKDIKQQTSVDAAGCFALGVAIGGVPAADKVCCSGLQSRTRKEDFSESCEALPVGGYAGICIACGDGVCDAAWESACNCPEDCRNK